MEVLFEPWEQEEIIMQLDCNFKMNLIIDEQAARRWIRNA
jgi:hypothetical protein